MKTLDISVILPIKSAITPKFDEYLESSIRSIVDQRKPVKELIIVHTEEETLKEKLSNYDFSGLTVNLLEFKGEPNFCSQVNYGVENCNTEWFSILEFDDEYSPIWFDNVEKYAHHFGDVDIFLPLVIDIDTKGLFAGFTNEATFAANFAQEMGILTNDICFEERDENFKYANLLYDYDSNYTKQLYNFLQIFKKQIGFIFKYKTYCLHENCPRSRTTHHARRSRARTTRLRTHVP
mgnify:CR=1 FL=1